MRRSFFIILVLITLVLGITSIYIIRSTARQQEVNTFSVDLMESERLPDGFLRVDGSQMLDFPKDFGPHPEFQTEWWYYTGNLQTPEGRRFGYQLTFFRRGLLPPQEQTARASTWGTNQVYMAHFALSDIEANQHYGFERFSRGAVDLAGTQAVPYRVWLEDWQVIEVESNRYYMTVSQDNIQLTLTLTDLKEPILHGKQGYSQKGPEDGNASYYYSQTRLTTSGVIELEDTRYQVGGFSWKDHEFSTRALSSGQIGWDWFSIQLEDGNDLMVFQIRRDDGSIDPFSSGTWTTTNGETHPLKQEDFTIQVLDKWTSPNGGVQYPSGWALQVPALKLSLEIRPTMADQEMNLSYAYWEGSVEISGNIEGKPIKGLGYVELTGYAASMEGEF